MYSYVEGIITEIESNYIVIDNNGIGYLIYTANPYSYIIGDKNKVYLYQYVREDEISLYGFKFKEERELFLKLINVKGLGCKMALPMLALGSIDGIMSAIDTENVSYLKKFPKIGDKVARQIILDLKGKLAASDDVNKQSSNELIEALESLGYKQNDIKRVIKEIDTSEPLESQIKNSLKLLLK